MDQTYNEGPSHAFSPLLSLLPIAVFIADNKGEIVFCNKACVATIGPLDRDLFQYARRCIDNVPYDFMAVCREVLNGKQNKSALVAITHPLTQQTAYYKISAKLFLDKYVLFTAIDHTEKVELEQTLEEKKSQFFSVITSLGDLVFKMDTNGYIKNIWSNDSQSAPLIRVAEDKHISESFPTEIVDILQKAVESVVKTSGSGQAEFLYTSDGLERWFSAQVFPVKQALATSELLVVAKEITQEKRNLQSSEYKSRLIQQLTSIKDGPLLHVVEGDPPRYCFITGNLSALIGYYSNDDLSERNWLDFIHDDDRQNVLHSLKELRTDPTLSHTDLLYRVLHREGSTSWVSNRISKFHDGGQDLLIGVIVNVTEIHVLHDKFRQRERILTNANQVAMIGAWEYDFKKKQFFLTDELYQIHEREPDEFEVLDSPSYYIEAHQPLIRQYLHELIEKGTKYDDELQLVTGNGKVKWVRTVGCAEWNNGEITHVYGVIQDIDERKKKDLILKEKERRFNAAFELAPLGIGLLSTEGRWLRVNVSLTRFFELSKDQLIDIPITNLQLINDSDQPFDWNGIVQSYGKNHQWEQKYLTEGGSIKWGRVNISAVKNESGTPSYFILQVVDITESKEYEGNLILARKEAEEANRIKSDFLSTMTHEIRTPLSGVIGITNLLLDEIQDPDHLEQLRALKFSSDSLLLLVNDILDFSRIRSGALSLESKPFDLKRVVEAIEELNLPRANEKGNRIVIDYDKDLIVDYLGDELRIGQILNNLVNNAVKFTENGLIEISIKKIGSTGNCHRLLVAVKDTGIGIPYDKQSSIFEQFTQADASISRRYGGTGLGLSIAKGLTEAMGGSIHLVSEPDNGTTLSFELLLEIAETERHPSESNMGETKDLQGKTILLVEDNSVSMLVAAQNLKKWNAHVIQATDGEKAVEQYLKNQETIDLVLMDINIPVLNGFEAAERIKKTNASIPIIAVTASPEEHNQPNTSIQAYLVKPFNIQDFYRVVKEHLKLY